ncbi:hypothetical protein JOD54_004993 [Actinokineospora baliensis]|uniref:hypothetical protein n=1 Tax=Actinokineospora baliensis TaxID=547056 RepID=UPI0019593327|nr:hypothetical protein [Actinokineospora baliensis]MBM7774789.1 hypothetical protein [Actinokineospora baliensis]
MRALRAIPAVIAALLITTLAPAAANAAPRAGCQEIFPPFAQRWNEKPWAYGCAIAPVAATADGSYQNFERGQMVSSPRHGLVISGFWSHYWDSSGMHYRIDFQWGHRYRYDLWQIQLHRDNTSYQGQWECFPNDGLCSSTGGIFGFYYLIEPGHSYQFRVRGCYPLPSGRHCPEGLTIPVWLWF